MHGRADLWLAAMVMVAVGIALLFAVYRLSARAKAWQLGVWGGILASLLLLFGFVFSGSVLIAQLLPLRCLPVCGNFAFPLSLMLAGLLLRSRIPRWRRVPFVVLLVGAASWALVAPLLSDTPACGDLWEGDVCIQSGLASCSAAAAATLLRYHEIEATEQEMAGLCLTSAKGTTTHGLFRGLLVKTKGTRYRPRACMLSLAELQTSGNLPAIASVALTAEISESDPRYAREWGWQIGEPHAVVILGFPDDGEVLVADPSVGPEHWRVEGLRDLMTGECILMTTRDKRIQD